MAASFAVGDRVVVASDAAVLSDVPPSGAQIGTKEAGTLGTVLAGPVSASGSDWWQIGYDTSLEGWSDGTLLAVPYFPPPETSGGWRSLVPLSQMPSSAQIADVRSLTGLDWSKLKLAYDYSASTAPDNTTLLVIRNDYVAFEWGDRNLYRVASVSKSLTGTVLAKLFDMSSAGQLANPVGPESFISSYLPASWLAADSRRGLIKIKDVMAMTSGLQPNDNPTAANYGSIVLGQPVQVAPEVQWAYASLPVDLLSIAMQTIAGKPVGDVFDELIAVPLGIAPIPWAKYDAYSTTSSGASITACDLARVGYLMMMNGEWVGTGGRQQVISAANANLLHTWPSFLASTVFTATPGSPFPVQTNSPQFYGLLWWTNRTQSPLGATVPADAYFAWGYLETFLVVVPSLDMVVVRYGHPPYAQAGYGKELMARVMDAVVPAGSGGGTQAVASLTLINADTDQPISGYDPLPSDTTLDLATLPTRNLNIRANTSPTTVGSVRFGLDGNGAYSTETAPPYALARDTSGDFWPWTLSVGSHSVTATPYSGAGGTGTAGKALTIGFSVTDSGGGG